ncbi:unnamed protein product [Auanema sp. JU1783]|nr:unnamed protein product [Auanema sp. JU1783]
MKFRFLGGLDCPDWLLGQFADYSKLTSIKFKNVCTLAVKFLLKNDVTDGDLERFTNESLDLNQLKGFMASLAFVIKRAVGYKCEISDIEAEIIQLGVPPEHGKVLCKVIAAHHDEILAYVREDIPKEPAMKFVSLQSHEPNGVSIKYEKEGDGERTLAMTKQQFRFFVNDLQKAQTVLERISK